MNRTFGCVIVCLSVAPLFAASNNHSYSLKRQPKVGDTLVYHVDANFAFQGRSATLTMDQTEKVVEVKADGTYNVETTSNDGKFTAGGKTRDLDGNQSTVACYDSCGCFRSLASDDADGFSARRANILAFTSPDNPVAVGGQWEHDWAADSDGRVPAAKATYKVEGEEKVDGVDVMRVAFNFAESANSDPITSTGHEWVSTSDGSVVKIEANFKNYPMGETGRPVDGSIVMVRK